jgi:hypothetical protein
MAEELHSLEVSITGQTRGGAEMAIDIDSSRFSKVGHSVEKAANCGSAAVKQGVNAALNGLDTAKETLDYAQDHVSEGVDYVMDMIRSVNDLVTRQPLLAVGGAFLIGYIAARMMRRVSST